MNKTFSAADIEECVEIACNELKIDKKTLEYEVLEEKKGFFKRSASILVKVPDEGSHEINEDKAFVESNNDGTVCINGGKIIVKNPIGGGKPASITFQDNIHIRVNGSEVNKRFNIFESDSIEVVIDKCKPSKKIEIDTSADIMEAYISITYTPEITYRLKDMEECSNCTLELIGAESIMPALFTYSEVLDELSKRNITYGIMKEKIADCLKVGCIKVLAAEGMKPTDAVDDSIDIKFKIDDHELVEDNNGNVDFKSIGSISGVNEGDIIAVKVEGHDGINGMDISGHIIKSRPMKKLKLKTGIGCTVKGDSIIALTSGKPCLKGSIFYVYKVHEVSKDVDISTGNIKFIGDVIVYGSVSEGMKLESGNAVTIYKNVERAKIVSCGDVAISGNIIASSVVGGGQDVIKLRILENITRLKGNIENLIEMVSEIKKYNLLGGNKRDGEIIKLLIDNRFKTLTRLCLSIISDTTMDKDDYNEDKLTELIKSRLLGLAPINIKHQSELGEIIDCINEKSEWINANVSLPVKVMVNYCQDSNIESSGDIIISGKGEYVSNITGRGSVIFTSDNSVARGGKIKAGEKILCKSVGSLAGVSTRLEVEKNGHIFAGLAYHNSIFVIGNREYILETDSKDLHAYIDSNDDVIVDKFIL